MRKKMRTRDLKMQIGKNGLTPSFLEQLKHEFERENLIKVSILKSATRDKEHAKEIADKILSELGEKFTGKLIGYVLTLQKWRRVKEK
jgi:RNA-binding protein